MSRKTKVEYGPDVLLLPAADACVSPWCGRPAGEHDEILHRFVAPARLPRPAFCVEALVETVWVCWSCGGQSDVWGLAGQEWMDCDHCGVPCFLQ